MTEEQKYIDFEAYERVAEPHKRERVSAWRTAIGLQDVDGLRVSDYLKHPNNPHHPRLATAYRLILNASKG